MSIFSLISLMVKKKTRTARLRCPECESDELGIRGRDGMEFWISSLTDTRKYRCFICKHEFRAPDRRKAPRAQVTNPGAVRKPA